MCKCYVFPIDSQGKGYLRGATLPGDLNMACPIQYLQVEKDMQRILLVDDEKELVSFLAEELNDQGFEVATAFDGVEAVMKVVDEKWDALLMDVRMPKLDGINALRIIQKIHPNMPVIMFTGQASQREISESASFGAKTCLFKPISTEKLIQSIRQVIA